MTAPHKQYSKFQQRPPWFGGHLQTLRNTLIPARVDLRLISKEEHCTAKMDDGSHDALALLFNTPHSPPQADSGVSSQTAPQVNRPTCVLLHGLGGSADSLYMRTTAYALLEKNFPVLRVNLRGAGQSGRLCAQQGHAGLTQDIRTVLSWFAQAHPEHARHGIVLAGYSLGGNTTLKFLGELSDSPSQNSPQVLAGAAVCAPIDLAAGAAHIHGWPRRPYEKAMLRGLKQQALRPEAILSLERRAAAGQASSLTEFDDIVIAPCNGYKNAHHYYAENSSRSFLPKITIPCLVLHALDDPVISNKQYKEVKWEANPWLQPLFTNRGGHVGFHGRHDPRPWYAHCLTSFFEGAEKLAD